MGSRRPRASLGNCHQPCGIFLHVSRPARRAEGIRPSDCRSSHHQHSSSGIDLPQVACVAGRVGRDLRAGSGRIRAGAHRPGRAPEICALRDRNIEFATGSLDVGSRHREPNMNTSRGEIMRKLQSLVLAIFTSISLGAMAQQGPVLFYGIMELSGTGATPGTNFDNGVKLAVKEINAAGGILGHKINYVSTDTQTNPAVAKAMSQKAIDDGAYVVLGPVHSGSMIVSMGETRRAEITNFTGGEAAVITQQGNPYVFRTSFTQSTSMPKLARYIKDQIKAKSIAIIFTNNDFGKGGRDEMAKAL